MGIKQLTILLILTAATMAQARPVSYPNGWMAMQTSDAFEHSVSLSYSPTARDAVGVVTDYMPQEDAWFHAATYNRLLWRRNTQDSQANLYALTAAGVVHSEGDDHAAGSLGFAADWETRRYFTSFENRLLVSDGINQAYMQKARVGIAPIVVPYDGLHNWLMLQVDHRPGMRHEWTATPLVRLFQQEWLGEFGISNHGDVLANFTYQF